MPSRGHMPCHAQAGRPWTSGPVPVCRKKAQAMLDACFVRDAEEVCDFQNPTSITMSRARRGRLIELAVRYGFLICEDDPYRRLRFQGSGVPPLKALDQHGVVIALGTVSKILSPGLRVGWAIVAPEIVERMSLQTSDGGSHPFT